MAWKPGNTSQLDLGEIPHKREISDEELTNMRANAPDREAREAAEAYQVRQTQLLEDIIAAGDESVDALNFIRGLQEKDEFGIGSAVLADDFQSEVEDKLDELNSPLDIDDVLEIWYKKELAPQMFYFAFDFNGIQVSDMPAVPPVVITSILLWDEKGLLCDRSLADYIIPEWLSRLNESVYEVIGKTSSQARRELIKLGFIEKHEIIT